MSRRRMMYGGKADANTLLLLHLDNNLTDSSPLNNETVVNNVTFEAGKFSYGALLNRATGYFTKNISAITNLSDWTIEFWYKDSGTGTSDYSGIFTTGEEWQISPWIGLRYMSYGLRGLFLYISDGATTVITDYGAINTVMDADWHHYAIVYRSKILYMYLDGVLKLTKVVSLTIPNFGSQLTTGTFSNNMPRDMFGVLDEFRISNIARYTENFTPPTKPFK